MQEYTNTEKSVVINLLSFVMEADSIIHPKEEDYMNEVLKQLNISVSDIDQMEEKDFHANRMLFKQMNKNKQNEIKKMMNDMASCDGYVDPRETDIIYNLSR